MEVKKSRTTFQRVGRQQAARSPFSLFLCCVSKGTRAACTVSGKDRGWEERGGDKRSPFHSPWPHAAGQTYKCRSGFLPPLLETSLNIHPLLPNSPSQALVHPLSIFWTVQSPPCSGHQSQPPLQPEGGADGSSIPGLYRSLLQPSSGPAMPLPPTWGSLNLPIPAHTLTGCLQEAFSASLMATVCLGCVGTSHFRCSL